MQKDSLRKVVLRGRDGKTLPGFAYQGDLSDRVRIITREGKEQDFQTAELKAIFFVRDFKGDPHYEEIMFLKKLPISKMLWVRVEFLDGEVLEGKLNNSAEFLNDSGFYLWPSDNETNNLSVFVVKSALKGFLVLSTVSS